MRLLVHVPRMGGEQVYAGFRWGNLMDRDHVEDPGLDGRIWWYFYIQGNTFRICCVW